MCATVPPVKDVLHFTAHVRQKETRNLMVANRTNMHWDLRPVIDGEFWTGAETFQVEPQQTKGYELVYKPLVMTTEGRKHAVRHSSAFIMETTPLAKFALLYTSLKI